MVASAPVEPSDALADLVEISSQIVAAVVFEPSGNVAAAIGGDGDALARTARELLEAASTIRPGVPVTRIEASTRGGGVFVVREGERLIAATTTPEPTSGLVLYDLRTALAKSARAAEPEPEKPKRRRTSKASGEGGDEAA